MHLIGEFYGSTGISDERFWIFLAWELTLAGKPVLESTEQLEVDLINLDRLYNMALKGKIEDAASSLALLMARPHIDLLASNGHVVQQD